jgi:hypothetical protein
VVDFKATAELFPSRRWNSNKAPANYQRLPSAAKAVQFAIETLPPEFLLGAILQVGDDRYDRDGIQQLYESKKYPLTRRSLLGETVMSKAAEKMSAARRNAETPFGKSKPQAQSFKLDQEREAEATSLKTARLRELRLAKEAADSAALALVPPKAPRKSKKSK